MERALEQERDRDALYIAWNKARETESPGTSREWVGRYPEYAADLTQWTADAPCAEWAEQQPVTEAEIAHTLAIGRNVVAEMRARYQTQTLTSVALTGLYEAARSLGVAPRDLAARLDIGLTTLAKLQGRLFRFASIPGELIQRVADALDVTAQQVRDYLQQPATLAARASYKSNGTPQVAAQEEFAQAVRNCRDMTDAQKARWLSGAPSEE